MSNRKTRKMRELSPFTVKQLREAAKLAGEKLTRRLDRYVITQGMAYHLDCPYPNKTSGEAPMARKDGAQ